MSEAQLSALWKVCALACVVKNKWSGVSPAAGPKSGQINQKINFQDSQSYLFPDRTIFSIFCALVGGDKPLHYKRSFTEQVGMGFIPTRDLACTGKDGRRKIVQLS
ncbi:MAG: hypothetical protein GY850_15325 [bacterium]|nr:hypothetical protein [bacterium]